MRKLCQIIITIVTSVLVTTQAGIFQAFSQVQADEINISQSVAQNSPQSSLPTYEDDIIKATVQGASFNQSGYLQVSPIIENKTAKDLLLALESQYPTMITDSGESGGCRLIRLKDQVTLSNSNPSSYSRLKPKQKVTVNLSDCQGVSSSSKAKSISINMSLLTLNSDRPTQFTLNISDIPIKR